MTALLVFGVCAGGLWWALRCLPKHEDIKPRPRLQWDVPMEGELEKARRKAARGVRLTRKEKTLLIRELIKRKGPDVDL